MYLEVVLHRRQRHHLFATRNNQLVFWSSWFRWLFWCCQFALLSSQLQVGHHGTTLVAVLESERINLKDIHDDTRFVAWHVGRRSATCFYKVKNREYQISSGNLIPPTAPRLKITLAPRKNT